jgi:hypothetical protein
MMAPARCDEPGQEVGFLDLDTSVHLARDERKDGRTLFLDPLAEPCGRTGSRHASTSSWSSRRRTR